ncbi:hypothetical protein B7P43_G15427 [Cryptotermes secundus]|uniref:Uncharacterized protein n=1 Tax=Cryptotermes secundus TaxID=105785 RepID=A0A2J7RB87_9NEOP|nr:uncharacterized protein LOC111862226 [Cryptotermes secundus]PNF38095.1 hypothetical protein B7P43_G15427 [Cryptotermes secundus]
MVCQGNVVICLVAALLVVITVLQAAEVPKSAFGEAFDEIVVESTLTVKGKGGSSRQSRNKALTLKSTSTSTSTTSTTESSTNEEPKRSKRESSEFHGPRVSNTNFARSSGRPFQVVDLFGRDLTSKGGLLGEGRS